MRRRHKRTMTRLECILFELGLHIYTPAIPRYDTFHFRYCRRMFEYWADELDREMARREML